MTNKTKLLISAIFITLAFAAGRYSAETPTVELKEVTAKERVKDTQTKRTTTTVKSPNGEVKTVTVVDTVSKSKTNEETAKEVVSKPAPKLNVSILGGYNVLRPEPMYGIAVSKQFIGPVTGGIWALSNGTLGVSVGLEF